MTDCTLQPAHTHPLYFPCRENREKEKPELRNISARAREIGLQAGSSRAAGGILARMFPRKHSPRRAPNSREIGAPRGLVPWDYLLESVQAIPIVAKSTFRKIYAHGRIFRRSQETTKNKKAADVLLPLTFLLRQLLLRALGDRG